MKDCFRSPFLISRKLAERIMPCIGDRYRLGFAKSDIQGGNLIIAKIVKVYLREPDDQVDHL